MSSRNPALCTASLTSHSHVEWYRAPQPQSVLFHRCVRNVVTLFASCYSCHRHRINCQKTQLMFPVVCVRVSGHNRFPEGSIPTFCHHHFNLEQLRMVVNLRCSAESELLTNIQQDCMSGHSYANPSRQQKQDLFCVLLCIFLFLNFPHKVNLRIHNAIPPYATGGTHVMKMISSVPLVLLM